MSDAGRRWALVGVALLVLIGAAAVGIYAGLYNIAADVPHTQPVYWLLETVRDRSIATRARDVVVPNDLNDPTRILKAAGQYADMCSGCHLAPGMKRTEISQGLYPRAPELRRKTTLTPAEQFWVVKHGIKMTGMPAWGVTHDDDLLWDVVAFVRKLPELTPEQYETLVKNAPKHEELMQEMEMGGEHQDNGDTNNLGLGVGRHRSRPCRAPCGARHRADEGRASREAAEDQAQQAQPHAAGVGRHHAESAQGQADGDAPATRAGRAAQAGVQHDTRPATLARQHVTRLAPDLQIQ